MKNSLQTRALAIALAIATLAVCLLAGFNFSAENNFDAPTDGIWWMEAPGGLRAERVPADSPGDRAGVRAGDILTAINDHPTPRLAPFEREIYRNGIWAHATYSILRPLTRRGAPESAAKLDIQVIVEPTDKSINQVSASSPWSTSPSASMSSSAAGPHPSLCTSSSSVWSPSFCIPSSTQGS
jgi:hypothetical protein